MITATEFYEQVLANKARLRSLILTGVAEEKAGFVSNTAILDYCSTAEKPLFLAMQFRTTLVKAYLMSMLKQPLYETSLYVVPFPLARSPQAFINAMHVQKTRLLADATGEARQDLFTATRDKMFHQFIPQENLEQPQSPYPLSPMQCSPNDQFAGISKVAPILSILDIPYWGVTFTRTPKGEGRKWTGELPKPPADMDKNLFVVADDLDIAPPANNPNLATKPYKRDSKEVVLTDELLEEI